MSNIQYGLISETDKNTLEATIDLIIKDANDGFINVLEIGVYGGDTGNGLFQYIKSKKIIPNIIGIDNNKDGEPLRFKYDKFIEGNSNEVYNQIPDNSQDLIFIDGLHTFAGVVSDFFCYAPKVKKGAYLAFHDTGKHIDPLSGWQGVGDRNDPDMCLGGVRKALKEIGLFNEWGGISMGGEMSHHIGCRGFELTYDEADPNDDAGGICVFKKLY